MIPEEKKASKQETPAHLQCAYIAEVLQIRLGTTCTSVLNSYV